jgi:hypothetical protein
MNNSCGKCRWIYGETNFSRENKFPVWKFWCSLAGFQFSVRVFNFPFILYWFADFMNKLQSMSDPFHIELSKLFKINFLFIVYFYFAECGWLQNFIFPHAKVFFSFLRLWKEKYFHMRKFWSFWTLKMSN